MLLTYIGSYVALSAAGGYRASQSGRLRYSFGFSVTDVYHWQPAVGRWEPFRDISGRDTTRGDPLGYFYSPLIRLDRKWRHPSRYVFDGSPATRPSE